jgi:hypothetical protein
VSSRLPLSPLYCSPPLPISSFPLAFNTSPTSTLAGHLRSTSCSSESLEKPKILTFDSSQHETSSLLRKELAPEHSHFHGFHRVKMQFPAIKAMLCLFSLLALLSFSTAAPAPNDKTLHTAPLDTRQESNGIYYGDLCNPKDPIAVWFPKNAGSVFTKRRTPPTSGLVAIPSPGTPLFTSSARTATSSATSQCR